MSLIIASPTAIHWGVANGGGGGRGQKVSCLTLVGSDPKTEREIETLAQGH